MLFEGEQVLVHSLPSVLVEREASEVRRGRPAVALDILKVLLHSTVTHIHVRIHMCLHTHASSRYCFYSYSNTHSRTHMCLRTHTSSRYCTVHDIHSCTVHVRIIHMTRVCVCVCVQELIVKHLEVSP